MNHTTKCLLGMVLAVAMSGLARGQEKEIKGWGAIVDPDSDCTITHKDGKLTILVPGTPHNLNEKISGLNAPRVLKEVQGDFSIEVKVTGAFDPDPESTVAPRGLAFNGAGLLIWQDEQNFIRLERDIWIRPDGQGFCFPPLFEYIQDGEGQRTNPRATLYNNFFEGDSTWFRLQRNKNQITASYSHDGKQWSLVRTIPVRLKESVSIGVAAINTSKKPFEAAFSELKIADSE